MATGIAYKKKLITAPASEPVTTTEAKTWLYVTGSDHDTLIGNLVKTARQFIEKEYDCALINQTWEIYLDGFPATDAWENPDGAIEPVLFPISSITSVSYIDTDGNAQTWGDSNYTLEQHEGRPGRILKAYNVAYPSTRSTQNSVTVRVVAGYGSSASDVPEPIRTAMQALVKFWYDNPEDVALKGNPWERSARTLLNNFFIHRL